MKELKLLCWNVNGVRSARAKGLLQWLETERPDIICFQECSASLSENDVANRMNTIIPIGGAGWQVHAGMSDGYN